MLDDISSVKTWSKVNEGMIKMYRAEVMIKLPIAQHIFFGSILTFPEVKDGELEDSLGGEEDEHGHIHGPKGHGAKGEGQAAGWGDCCGIPIPSAFAAAAMEKEKEGLKIGGEKGVGVSVGMGMGNVRRIPFD